MQRFLGLDVKTHQATQAGVVPELRMCIQWQVVSEQADLVAEERRQASPFHAYNLLRFAAPKITVMYQQRVRLPGNRLVNQLLACSDAGRESRDLRTAFHLQAVRTIVLELIDTQALVQILAQFNKAYAHRHLTVALRATDLACSGNHHIQCDCTQYTWSCMKQNLSYIVWPAIAGLLGALLILDRWVLPAPGAANSQLEPDSYATAVREATPSVVNIYTAKLVAPRRSTLLDHLLGRLPPPAQRNRIEKSLGSGVIMTQEGHILTNNHVIADADAIQVMLYDGRTANAKVIGTDAATDLAVLKVDLPDLQPITLGNSDAARVGDVVLAIGNPLGFGHSVSQGIVSALGRFGFQSNAYEDYIQTDAIIHLGNSGGALIDTRGRLLGINTLIYTANNPAQSASTGIGIGLAIPESLAVFVMHDLIDYGEVIRGWLGVIVEPVDATSSNGDRHERLAVTEVAANSPAEKAGVRVGDIITQINGAAVTDGRLTVHRIAMLKPGESVSISVQRNRQSIELNAIVGVLNQSGEPTSLR
jgi:serine protease DegS